MLSNENWNVPIPQPLETANHSATWWSMCTKCATNTNMYQNATKNKVSWNSVNYAVKMCSLLKFKNNLPWVIFTHFLEKKAPFHIRVDFPQFKLARLHIDKILYLNWKVIMVLKRSLFAQWAIQNYSDTIAATHLKWKNENNLS